MENQPLSSQIRLRAAICHLSGLTWLPIALIFNPLANQHSIGYLAIFILPVLGIILASLLTLLVWKISQRVHPFVDRAGRYSSNLMLSYSLYLIVLFSLMSLTCGIPGLSTVGLLMGIATLYLLPLTLCIHGLLLLVGAIFAVKSQVYSYPFTIKFLTEEIEGGDLL